MLERGFALVRDGRAVVASAARARGQVALELEFGDGKVQTVVAPGSARRAPPGRRRRPARRAGSCDARGREPDRAPAPGDGAAARSRARLPWDLEQDFASIAPYTIEEAYEVADAIERGDTARLADELGDLLLQVVFHARMAEEAGRFDFARVAAAIADKMIRRHPHVFGEAEVASAAAQTRAWEAARPWSGGARPARRARRACSTTCRSPCPR